MDFTELLDAVADCLALATPGNVLAFMPYVVTRLESRFYGRYWEFEALPHASRERIVREWFDAIEPAEPRFTPWYGPWPTEGF